MRVYSITQVGSITSGASVEDIKVSLKALAESHNVTVAELLKSAKAAGPCGPEYLVRAANLNRRLERLEANQ